MGGWGCHPPRQRHGDDVWCDDPNGLRPHVRQRDLLPYSDLRQSPAPAATPARQSLPRRWGGARAPRRRTDVGRVASSPSLEFVKNSARTWRHANAVLRLRPQDYAPLLYAVHSDGEGRRVSRGARVDHGGHSVDVGACVRSVDQVLDLLLAALWPMTLSALTHQERDGGVDDAVG
jgi:hypothetical protein